LVFFGGCAVGLIISEILVGVASQKAQQDAHRASSEYIEQIRNGGNGSLTFKERSGKTAHRGRHEDAHPTASHHVEVLQTGILSMRTGSLTGNSLRQSDQQKLRHQTSRKESKSNGGRQSQRPWDPSEQENIPDTTGPIHIPGNGKNGVLALLCSRKNCSSTGTDTHTYRQTDRQTDRKMI
jgi:hypothetical protein